MLRAVLRGGFVALVLLKGSLRFTMLRLRLAVRGERITPLHRAEWMYYCAVQALKALGIKYRIEGTLPASATLIAANHLSYLDIVIFSAAMPCVFVAKQEIASWPIFGRLARVGGTIFVDRDRCMSAWDTAEIVRSRLADGVSVLVFPEGTSTDGSEVQRFRSTLFGPAAASRTAVTPAVVFYQPGVAQARERDFCWFGDDLFLPHLRKVLGSEGFSAVVRFSQPEIHSDRKTAAWRSHDAVSRMREAGLDPVTNRVPALSINRGRAASGLSGRPDPIPFAAYADFLDG